MKKTFPLHVPGKQDLRVVDAIKVDISRYVKRERRKALPEGVDFWDFNCRVGPDREDPPAMPLAEVPKAVEAVAQAGGDAVYVEILACPGHREDRPKPASIERTDSL